MKLTYTLLIVCTVATASVSYAQPGTLDPTFGNGGIATTDLTQFDHQDYAYGIAIQDDGKFLVAGVVDQFSTFSRTLSRHNADGTLDTAFGEGGYLEGASGSWAFDVALQPDGKILLAGHATVDFDIMVFLSRYHPDGSPDSSFHFNGDAFVDLGWTQQRAKDIYVQSDGKILLAVVGNLNFEAGLVRFNTDGYIDSTFGTNGVVIPTNFWAGYYPYTHAEVSTQSDGKILLTGLDITVSTIPSVARFNTDGTLDNTFGTGGIASTAFIADGHISSLLVLPDDRMLLSGTQTNATDDFVLTRLLPDGTTDVAFGDSGLVVTDHNGGNDNGRGLAIQTNGMIVQVGTNTAGSANAEMAALRYFADGTLDTAFGQNGIAIVDIGSEHDRAIDVVLQSDGKIVLAGFGQPTTSYDIALVRLNGGGGGTVGNVAIPTIGDISIFPNPITASCAVRGTQANGTVVIYDLSGRELKHLPSSERVTHLNTQSLTPGYYTVQYINGSNGANLHFIKL